MSVSSSAASVRLRRDRGSTGAVLATTVLGPLDRAPRRVRASRETTRQSVRPRPCPGRRQRMATDRASRRRLHCAAASGAAASRASRLAARRRMPAKACRTICWLLAASSIGHAAFVGEHDPHERPIERWRAPVRAGTVRACARPTLRCQRFRRARGAARIAAATSPASRARQRCAIAKDDAAAVERAPSGARRRAGLRRTSPESSGAVRSAPNRPIRRR